MFPNDFIEKNKNHYCENVHFTIIKWSKTIHESSTFSQGPVFMKLRAVFIIYEKFRDNLVNQIIIFRFLFIYF